MYWSHIASFLGWLKNIDKEVEPDKAEDLIWLSDSQLVINYLNWKFQRAGNVTNGGATYFLTIVLSLVHPVTGYLTQRTELGRNYSSPLSPTEWLEHCTVSFNTLKEVAKDLDRDKTYSRNPFESVRHVVSLADPMAALQDMLQRMRADRHTPGSFLEAIMGRDILLIQPRR